MSKSRSLASVLLLALLLNIFPAPRAAASTRPTEQGKRGIKLKPSAPATDKKRPARPAPTRAIDAAGANDEQPSKSGAMRLVVQLGLRNFQYGFAAFSPDSRLIATGGRATLSSGTLRRGARSGGSPATRATPPRRI